MSKAESQLSAAEELSVSEGNVRDEGIEPLESPPGVYTPKTGDTTNSRPTFQVYGNANCNVQLREAHTWAPLSGTGYTNKYREYSLVVNTNLRPGPCWVICALWRNGDWTMDTLPVIINVTTSKDNADTYEGGAVASVPGAGRQNNEDDNSAMGFSRPFFYNMQQGTRVERRPTFQVGGHANSWLRIADSRTGIELTNHKKTDGTGDTTLTLNSDLKQGIHDVHVYQDGLGNWFQRSKTLRVLVLDRPVITHASKSSPVRGQGAAAGAIVYLHRASVGSYHGEAVAKADGSFSIAATNLQVGWDITCRQGFTKDGYAENTYSEWAYNVPVTT